MKRAITLMAMAFIISIAVNAVEAKQGKWGNNNDLLTSGNISFLDALKVGAAVEELDISDLKEALGKTDNQDIQAVYQNLMKGSRNHLRSYVNMLHNYGESYHAVYLTSEEAAEIIDAPMERGAY